jgi:hypothetical protein
MKKLAAKTGIQPTSLPPVELKRTLYPLTGAHSVISPIK